MAATLKSLGAESVSGRRIAVLGPMRELGEHGPALHAALADPVRAASVDAVILVGEDMRPLADALGDDVQVTLVNTVEAATEALVATIRAGDAVLVKASNSIGLAKLVEAVKGGIPCST